MEKNPRRNVLAGKVPILDHALAPNIPFIGEDLGRSDTLDSELRIWKDKHSFHDQEEFIPDTVIPKGNNVTFDEGVCSSFSGASHPPEPVDTDLMRAVYGPIGQSKAEAKCLVKSLQVKGRFLEDLSIQVPVVKPSTAAFSPTESLLEEAIEEKECVWDSSLPPSGDISPYRCMSTYRSAGMLSMDRNYETVKGGCVRGDSLESGKTSLSRASDSSGLSDDSHWTNNTVNKPHKGNDPKWKSIIAIRARDGILGMSHFRLLKRLGCGDIGSVYLSELSGTRCFFAMKVMDKASLASRNKLNRAQTEREILQLLDHPFLPTLYTHFETDRFSCLVMEYCPGGDLHTLRQRQPKKRFSEYAARFYAAEVLLALEYLHMLGVVYRDLKPENVLVRDDGHIMLSDFDLSLKSTVSPTLIKTSSFNSDPSYLCSEPSSVCVQPSCFLPRLKKKSPKVQKELNLPELIAEPTSARSMSFVGTHEYLAPEVIKQEGHGSAVDWWTFGIFLHELLYGKTPFKGSNNRATLFNVIGQELKFPDSPSTSYAGRDLIKGLLVKEPHDRLGVKRGASEIKQHPFFEGVNWALIRCGAPPDIPIQVEYKLPGKYGAVDPAGIRSNSKRVSCLGADIKPGGKYLDFEFF